MRIKTSFILVFIVFILAAGAVFAESPNEQFKQMVAQLQKSPNDNALRERIIKLAQELKPAPAVPEEAERRMARGTAAFKGAKSVADYRDAAKEFEQATLAAPWYGDAYFNLGVTQDKAENYEAALRSLKLAQLASPDSKDIKQLIYEVEYRNEKANSQEARAAREREQQKLLLKSLDGAQWQKDEIMTGYCHDEYIEIHGNEIYSGWIVTRPYEKCYDKAKLGDGWYVMHSRVEGRDFIFDERHQTFRGTISEDGEKITIKMSIKPSATGYPFEKTSTYTRVKNPIWSIMSGKG